MRDAVYHFLFSYLLFYYECIEEETHKSEDTMKMKSYELDQNSTYYSKSFLKVIVRAS